MQQPSLQACDDLFGVRFAGEHFGKGGVSLLVGCDCHDARNEFAQVLVPYLLDVDLDDPFVEEAREESVATILDLHERRNDSSELVVTGCMAERYGSELAEALPEADRISGFGVPVAPVSVPVVLGPRGATGAAEPGSGIPEFDLLNLPRPESSRPWAYVKIAEGCDKRCGFCAIPSFRGPQRSRGEDSILAEVEQLQVREVVLVAQDLGAYGRDGGKGERRITELFAAVSERVDWVRLLYLFPSELTDGLIEAIAGSPVPYFDL